MVKQLVSLQWFRRLFFPFIFVLELALFVLFLVLPYYQISPPSALPGYLTVFGWLLAFSSFLVATSSFLLFLSSFPFINASLQRFFQSERAIRILGFTSFFTVFIEIVLLGITQIFFTLFASNVTPMFMIIIGLSLLLPIFLYFIANFSSDPQNIYALSSEAPMRLQLTAFWLVFITAFTQIFATQWEFVVIGGLLLLSAYLFFFLYRSAVVITPSILLIHFVFSLVLGILSLVKQKEIIQELLASGETITVLQATLLSVFIFLVPGIISLLLAQSFFRKWVIAWIRDVHPEPEMEIQLEMAD
ncbi:MAG: hypothetical protein ACTSUA_09640 [Candidatus Heimdallarchaeota archaeon]